jgi:hypothetical protein
MRSNPHRYARKLRARVMRLLIKKLFTLLRVAGMQLYNFPIKLLKSFYKGFPVVFPGKYLKNNT